MCYLQTELWREHNVNVVSFVIRDTMLIFPLFLFSLNLSMWNSFIEIKLIHIFCMLYIIIIYNYIINYII